MKNFEAMIQFKTEHYDVFSKLRDHTKWSEDKVYAWFHSINPLIGNVTPISMINIGRKDKLDKFIDSCISTS